MEITIALPKTNLFGNGSDKKPDKTEKRSSESGKASDNKDIFELSETAKKALQGDHASKSAMKYEMLRKKTDMKLEAAAVLKNMGHKPDSGKDDTDGVVAKAGRAMKAAAAVSSGKEVSREDLDLLRELDPDMYFLTMLSAKAKEVTENVSEDTRDTVNENTQETEKTAEYNEALSLEAAYIDTEF